MNCTRLARRSWMSRLWPLFTNFVIGVTITLMKKHLKSLAPLQLEKKQMFIPRKMCGGMYSLSKCTKLQLWILRTELGIYMVTVVSRAVVSSSIIPGKWSGNGLLKEFRNLRRMVAGGIRCPEPFLHLGNNVLLMEFIGESHTAAPHLKDASLSLNKLRRCYLELIKDMRKLYQKCNLVHGDLTEYNILYFKDQLYIIDVSQAVDRHQDKAFVFLREDCLHVSEFFRKEGVAVMKIRELFDFIVDANICG